ncbi:LysR family transcriptional regulator [Phaeobacter sp. 11ANDIMAR09]|uniref:LysR family transcriptional regulator n=1 Tax=Phaeobacter sp. 11ANDIMAR09 TaxID=1225647 RepID=UPI0006C8A091|nr:LysR family transcriptional regulator [Phaeobacter sp. 11ANDIMAR09]KPD10622.1 carbonate dehydratase [Phaeobacter sp. 11ANDIMAR09]
MRLPLSTLEVFNAIAREGSMSAAAQALGIKRSTVSHQLKSLEDQLGTALFVRTTRAINLTEAGRALMRASGPAFEQLADGLETARSAGHSARGELKLAAPEFAYQLLLRDKLVSFQAKYPEISLELSLTDAFSDILHEGLHAGFRLGGLVAQDMIAKSLTSALTSAVVASPAYLERHGVPEFPKDLLNHNCLGYRFQSSGQLAPWAFASSDGDYTVIPPGNLVANSVPVTIDMAMQGLGIAYTFREICEVSLGRSDLVEILPGHRVTMPGINIYFPQEYRSFIPLRLLIKHLQVDETARN